jgi:iron(II)-dependent oxidoreductase
MEPPWTGGRTPPSGVGSQPVRWVSLGEARAFCAFHGKRLPTEIEWQRAAQGDDGRRYPWGNDRGLANGTSCPPLASRVLESPPPSNVTAYLSGASPFGVLDLVGEKTAALN